MTRNDSAIPGPAPLSVLIVEDVTEMRSLLEHVVSGISGLVVSGTAQNCLEARLELTRRRPDLVLLDELLPGESSSDFLKDLCLQKIPVILISSLEVLPDGLPPGACARMAKPGWKTIAEDQIRIKNVIFHGLKRSQA